MMRVLICGGRNFENRKQLRTILSRLHAERPISVVIEGDSSGADRLASEWARHNSVCNIKIPAHWNQLGRKAGPIRNGWMIQHCSPDCVLAFPGGPGTADMVQKARAAGVEVIEVEG